MSDGTVQLDDTDRRIVAALQVNGRASWQQIARVVGTSDSTVARRAQRLLESKAVRVVGVADPLRCGYGYPVLVQIRCTVGAAPAVARSLASRPDVRFVALITGSFDIVLELIVSSQRHLARVLLKELNYVPGITSTTTENVLRHHKLSHYWSQDLLDDTALAVLQPQPEPALDSVPRRADQLDMRLLELLGVDGRRSVAELAARLDITESMARRRLEALTGDGRARFATVVQAQTLGYDVELFVWLSVDLGHLEEIVDRLRARREVRYLSVTAGYSDLACEVILRDADDLYRFNTQVLGSLPGIRSVELGLELQTVKRAYLLTVDTDGHLPDTVHLS